MAGKEYRLTILVSGRDTGAKSMLGGIGSALGSIGTIAGGILSANFFSQLANQVKEFAIQAVQATAEIQRMEMMLQTLQARELIKTGQFTDMNAALAAAAPLAKATMDQLERIAVISPYQLQTVNDTYRMAMAFGYTSKEATVFTKALLDMAAGVGADSGMLDRMAYNLAQVRLQGKVTAMDIRQLAMAGLDLNDVLKYVGTQMGVNIKDHLDFNKAIEQGKITWEDFTKYFGEYADKNFGGAAARMSTTLYGLWSTFKDLFALSMPKILGPALEKVTVWLNDLLTKFMEIRDSGVLEAIGQKLADMLDSGKIREGFANMFKGLDISGLKSFIDENLPNIMKTLSDAFAELKPDALATFADMLDFSVKAFNRFSDWIKENGPLIEEFIRVEVEMFKFWARAIMSFWNVVEPVLGLIETALLGLATIVMQLVTGDLAGAWETMKTTTYSAFEYIKVILLNFFNWVTTMFGSSGQQVIAVWTGILQNFGSISAILLNRTFANIKLILTGIISYFIGAGPQMTVAVASWIPGIDQTLSKLVAIFLAKGTAMPLQIIFALQGMIGRVQNAVVSFINSVISVITAIVIPVTVNLPNFGSLAAQIRAGVAALEAAAGGGGGGSGYVGGKSTSGGNSNSGSRACFTGDTLVTLASGEVIPFSEMRVGHKVLSYDTVLNDYIEATVEDVFLHGPEEIDGYYIFNGFLKVTAEHMIFVNREWIAARDIQIGDHLLDQAGSTVIISSKAFVGDRVPTFNLHTNHETHNYFANGLLVHNAKFAEGGISRGPSSGYQATLHGTEAVIPLKNGSVPVSLGGTLNPSMGNGGNTFILQFSYAPAVSTASKYEAQDVLVPMLQEAMRTEFNKRGM